MPSAPVGLAALPGARMPLLTLGRGQRADAAQSAAVDGGEIRRGDRAVHFECASGHHCGAGIGIRPRQDQRPGALFDERADDAAAGAAILDDPGEGGRAIVAAHGQDVVAEKDVAVAFDRAGRDGDVGSKL